MKLTNNRLLQATILLATATTHLYAADSDVKAKSLDDEIPALEHVAAEIKDNQTTAPLLNNQNETDANWYLEALRELDNSKDPKDLLAQALVALSNTRYSDNPHYRINWELEALRVHDDEKEEISKVLRYIRQRYAQEEETASGDQRQKAESITALVLGSGDFRASYQGSGKAKLDAMFAEAKDYQLNPSKYQLSKGANTARELI